MNGNGEIAPNSFVTFLGKKSITHFRIQCGIKCSMVFCFSGIDFEEAIEGYGEIFSPNDLVLFTRSVLHTVDLPYELGADGGAFRRLIEYSASKEIIIVACMRAKIGNLYYNSAALIDKGRVMGVSDELNPLGGYVGGKVFRSYVTSIGKVCLFIDSDVCNPFLYQSVINGGRYVFSLNSCNMDSQRLLSARALANAFGKYVLCKFEDCGVCINSRGVVESIKWGKMSAFYLPMTLAKGKEGEVKFVEEI